MQSVTAGIRLNGTLSQRLVALHFADVLLSTHACPAAGASLCAAPPPFSQRGQSLYHCTGPLFYTSCWCEPSLHFPLLFQSQIKTKTRDDSQHQLKAFFLAPEVKTDTQDRQAEGLFRESQWKRAEPQYSASLKPSQCLPCFFAAP